MIEALRAEWTKLRTVANTGWLLLATVAVTTGVSVAVAVATHVTSRSDQDPTRLSLTGIDLGQTVIAVLAVLAISEEYGTGMIRISLAAIPCRHVLLFAKATSVAVLALLAGALAVAGSLLIGRLLLPAAGLNPAHGYALVSIGNGPTLGAAAGSVLYLALIALFSLGVATIIRDTGVAVGVVLGLLYLPPILAQVVSDPLRRHILQIAPMSAGLAIQATTNLRTLPIAPWAGLGVLAAWTAAALFIGGTVLRLRDA